MTNSILIVKINFSNNLFINQLFYHLHIKSTMIMEVLMLKKYLERSLVPLLIIAFLTVSLLPDSLSPKAFASSAVVKHAIRTIYIRTAAKSPSKVIGTLPPNAPVVVYRSSGSYYKINYKNKTAYTLKKYVASGRPKALYTGYGSDTVYLHSITTGKTLKQTFYLATPIHVYARQGHWLTIGYSKGYHGYALTYDSHIVRYAKRGIDLSYLQPSGPTSLNFWKIKQAGFHFAIIKASEGTDLPKLGSPDYFVQDVWNAHNAGLKVHAYHMFDATSNAAAIAEANHFAQQLNPVKKLLGYVFVDVEYANLPRDPNLLTSYVNIFITQLKKDGYSHVGIYSYYDFYFHRLNPTKLLNGNLLWIARYNATLGMKANVWQHRETNCTINGVNGKFDFDLTYTNLIGG